MDQWVLHQATNVSNLELTGSRFLDNTVKSRHVFQRVEASI